MTDTPKTFDQLLDEAVANMRKALDDQGVPAANTMLPPYTAPRAAEPEQVARALADGDGSRIPKDGPTTYGGRFMIEVPADGDQPAEKRHCAYIRTVWDNGAVRDHVAVVTDPTTYEERGETPPAEETVAETAAPVDEAAERTEESETAPPESMETTVTEETKEKDGDA